MSLRLGLDIGGTKTAALVGGESGAPLGRAIQPTDVTHPPRPVSRPLPPLPFTQLTPPTSEPK